MKHVRISNNTLEYILNTRGLHKGCYKKVFIWIKLVHRVSVNWIRHVELSPRSCLPVVTDGATLLTPYHLYYSDLDSLGDRHLRAHAFRSIHCDLTHRCRVTHICASKLPIIGSDNGLSPGRCQATIWTNAGILLIGPIGTNFNEILIEIYRFSFKKIHFKMSSGKWRTSCLSLSVLNEKCISGVVSVMATRAASGNVMAVFAGNIRDWGHLHRYAIQYINVEDGSAICIGRICMPLTLSR